MATANILTDAGEAWIIDQLDAVAGNRYLGWGTGGTTAAKANTALTTEASEARVAATESQPTADAIKYVATMIANGTKTINEAGIFSASTAGTMILSITFTGVDVVLSSEVEISISLTQL